MKLQSNLISPIFSYTAITAVVILGVVSLSIGGFGKADIMDTAIVSPRPSAMAGADADRKADPDCACERTFAKAYPIVWNGKVIASFVSGEDIGVRRYTKNPDYNQFYVLADSKYKGDLDKDVQVSGRLVGVTCAYKNTVFGECVAEVEADKITELN